MKNAKFLDTPPETFDGFGFYSDPKDGQLKFFYFDDIVQTHGVQPQDPSIPSDREPFHVLLSSVRKGLVHLEHPFTSNFIDPLVYARHIARAGFGGIMIRVSKFSTALLNACIHEIVAHHLQESGFVLADITTGLDVFYQGLKTDKSK